MNGTTGANNTLTVEGQVTTARDFYNGRKELVGTVTQYVDNFLGASHDLKVGFDHNDSWSSWMAQSTWKVSVAIQVQ